MEAADKSGLDRFAVSGEDLVLYHGSGIPGIKNFKPAQHQTMGAGLYCTSERASAEVYASWRAQERYSGEIDAIDGFTIPETFSPTVYKFHARGMRFYDLRDEQAEKALHPLWIKYLKENKGRLLEGRSWPQKAIVDDVIHDAGSNRPLNCHSFTGGYGSYINQFFTDFLEQMGFDGLVGMEYDRDGEFNTGVCNSYVVFDPAKLEPVSEDALEVLRLQSVDATS